MKKVLLSLFIINIFILISLSSFGESDIKVFVEKNEISFDTKPYIDQNSGRTMVPVRFVAENLNCNVEWRAYDQTIIIREKTDTLYHKIAYLKIGRKKVYTTNSFDMDTHPVLKEGRTFIPIRAVSELFSMKVNWDASTRTIHIEKLILVATPEPKVTPIPIPLALTYYDSGYTIVGSKYEDTDNGRSYNLDKSLNYFHINTKSITGVESVGTISNNNDGTIKLQTQEMLNIFSSKYKFSYEDVLDYVLTHNEQNYKLKKDFPTENSKKLLTVTSDNTSNIGFMIK